MKTFDLKKNAAGGEYVLGLKDTGTHACYLIYGSLAPGEGGRLVRPGKGHEEMVLAVKGDLEVTGHFTGTLKEGSAFHIAGEAECYLRNPSADTAIYVAAGGHTPGVEH